MSGRIMLVDDDDEVLVMNKTFLEELGYEVLCASDGEGCLSKLEEEPQIDLLLLDVRLPGIDGFEVCRRLRAKPETARLGIIILTAKKDVQDKVTGLEVGADDYLTKPFELPELAARIKAHLRIRELERELREKEKAATIGQMAITLSHEINNPLTSIIWHTRLLQEELAKNTDMPEKVFLSLETIAQDAHRIEKVLKRLYRIKEPVLTSYTADAQMIDLQRSLPGES